VEKMQDTLTNEKWTSCWLLVPANDYKTINTQPVKMINGSMPSLPVTLVKRIKGNE
jgi:hypothetical protein